ncbi:MAG TPA: hypothetical protein VFB63_08545 [Bryobacteraceae bacterium]|nr:hypothetical protein [Bryobacteraceae bacterium]
MRSIVFRLATVTGLLAAVAFSQTSTGQISLTVLDPSGAVVPNANLAWSSTPNPSTPSTPPNSGFPA